MREDIPQRELARFEGCLIGQAPGGCARGSGGGYPPETCARYVDVVLRTRQFERAVRLPYRFDQYSDETQLALSLDGATDQRRSRLNAAVDAIQARFGDEVLRRGSADVRRAGLSVGIKRGERE